MSLLLCSGETSILPANCVNVLYDFLMYKMRLYGIFCMGDSDLLNYVSRDYLEIPTCRKSISRAYRVRPADAKLRQAAIPNGRTEQGLARINYIRIV